MGPGGKAQFVHCRLHDPSAILVHHTVLAQELAPHPSVVPDGIIGKAVRLNGAGLVHLRPHGCAAGTFLAAGQFLKRNAWHLQVQVNPVQQGTADFAHVFFNLLGAALAGMPAVTQISARARVHAGNEDKLRGKCGGAEGARNGHLSLLQGLTQYLQAFPVELGQLVQKKHPMVGQTDFSGGRRIATTHHSRITDCVVGRPERSGGQETLAGNQSPHGAVNPGGFKAFRRCEFRKNGRQPLGQHGFAGSGTANHQDIVRPGSSNRQGALGVLLATDIREIDGIVIHRGFHPGQPTRHGIKR